jgi:hypothetical protein
MRERIWTDAKRLEGEGGMGKDEEIRLCCSQTKSAYLRTVRRKREGRDEVSACLCLCVSAGAGSKR